MRLLWAAILCGGCFAPAPGDRASACDYWTGCPDGGAPCPVGEDCSDQTPDGLHFSGAALGDNWLGGTSGPRATALGGTQTIRVYGLGGLAFDVTGDDALAAVPAGPSTVTVTGLAAGTGSLRIVEPGTGLLYDRISLDVAVVADLALTEATPMFDAEAERRVLWNRADHDLVVALTDGAGDRVVDESLVFALPVGMTQTGWDSADAPSPTPAGDAPIAVTLGSGSTHAIVARFVDVIDDVVWIPFLYVTPPAAGLQVGQRTEYFFRAVRAGAPVSGAPFDAVADARLQTDPMTVNAAFVEAVAPGIGHLTIHSGTASRDFQIPIAAALSQPEAPRAPAPETSPGPAPGERASHGSRP